MLTFLIMWLLIGIFAVCLATYAEHRNGDDLLAEHIPLLLGGVLLGPLVLIAILGMFFDSHSQFVLIKGYKKGPKENENN